MTRDITWVNLSDTVTHAKNIAVTRKPRGHTNYLYNTYSKSNLIMTVKQEQSVRFFFLHKMVISYERPELYYRDKKTFNTCTQN